MEATTIALNTLKTASELFLFSLFVFSLLMVPKVTAEVLSGSIDYIWASNFISSHSHPYEYSNYHPTGAQGQVLVNFVSTLGTGAVTIKAFSDAFTSDTMTTVDVSEAYVGYSFDLTFEIKADIDGTYEVTFEARNQFNAFLDRSTTTIEVWSPSHLSAADKLYSVESRLISFIYQSPQGIENITLAQNDFIVASLDYSQEKWNEVTSLCDSSLSYIEKANAAEIAWLQQADEITSKSTEVNDATVNLYNIIATPAQFLLYLTIIIFILAIVFLIVSIWRKIKPAQIITPT